MAYSPALAAMGASAFQLPSPGHGENGKFPSTKKLLLPRPLYSLNSKL
jgi:hypothetical protein